ncbi:hypothetical protein ABEB36_012011 [Hypothenemus hampei]|uniref:Tetraspanin n=1 Tax=Hypothenemus hampei TaxID=57062 RepID=A0ABD1EAG2_HYPHA
MPTTKELDLGMKCIKYMLCVSNFMFVIVGLLLISIGYTIKTIYGTFDDFMEGHYYHPSTLAIVIGFFIFFVAFFGCVGAFKESTFMVNMYAFLLTLIFILQISACIAAYAMRSNISESLYENMKNAMDHFDEHYNAFIWNTTQFNLQCCGIDDPTDWNAYIGREGYGLINVTLPNYANISVPASCCFNENCSVSRNLYTAGCLNRLSGVVSQCALLFGIGALCVAFIQILGIVFASVLAKSIRKVKTQRLVATDERRRQLYNQLVKNQEQTKSPELYTPKDSEA